MASVRIWNYQWIEPIRNVHKSKAKTTVYGARDQKEQKR